MFIKKLGGNMKAWIVSSEESCEPCSSLVWAETRGKAKQMANYGGPYLYQSDLEVDDFTAIRAVRAKNFDDCEELSEKEICLKLIRENGFCFYVGNNFYNEDNIDEFKKLFEEEI